MNIQQASQKYVQSGLLMFSEAMFELSGKTWLYNWHQQAICDALEKVVIGKTKRLIINIPPRYSKAQPYSELVATPHGFVTMGSLRVGDVVIGSDGSHIRVEGIYEQGSKDVYEVTLKCGNETRCTRDHLFTVTHKDWKAAKTIDVNYLLENNRFKKDHCRYQIQQCEPVQFNWQYIPLDPWLLGFLIGDGGMSGHTLKVTNSNIDKIKHVSLTLPCSDMLSRYSDSIDYTIRKRKNGNSKPETLAALITLGLHGKKSVEKFIPDIYKVNSVEVRRELFQGLIDSDGTKNGGKIGSYIYATSSPRLAEDMTWLARSLGMTVSISVDKSPKYSYKGELRIGKPAYTLSITCRKKQSIVSTRNTEKMEKCRCIKVSAKDSLYVAGDFIVTHNTEIAVVNFMAWSMGLFPYSEFIHASYSKRLATNNAYHTRALMMGEAYQAVFPDVKLKDDSKAKDEFRTEQGGIVYATGAEGTITGYGAGKVRGGFGGAIIIDDPTKAGEAMSDVRRQNVIDWYQSTVESRCNSPETPIIVIMQRLHENDLTGWLLDGGTGEEWTHLCIPAINEDGEPLWPAKHDLTTLQRMEQADPYNFAGQYMQTPTPKEGGMFKAHWISRYRDVPEERYIIRIVQSWDTAYKAAQINDPSACTTWAETKDGYYLLHAFVKRMEYPELKRVAKVLADEWQPDALLIEDKASGQSLIQELRGETGHAVIAIHPDADKETRANAVTSLFEAGRVLFPHDAPWLKSVESELFMFPLGRHDDQVDSISQALRYMKEKTNMLPISIHTQPRSIYGGGYAHV